jgi:hypothetical protein
VTTGSTWPLAKISKFSKFSKFGLLREAGGMDDVDSDSGSDGEPKWRSAAVLVQTCDKYSWFWPAWHFFFHRCAFASLSLPSG